jgi:hypothetical protein
MRHDHIRGPAAWVPGLGTAARNGESPHRTVGWQDPGLAFRQDPGLRFRQDPGLAFRQDPGLAVRQDPGFAFREDPG